MTSRTVLIGTDVATLMLFHPDDLSHRADAPIAWYSMPFAYQPEAAAGRLAAFGTGSDGGYEVRLTTGGLTGPEAARPGPTWDFPLQVRHGRVLLDNSDALPGLEQMTDPAEMDTWFDLANGAYRATVHAIDRRGSGDDEDGPALDDLPDYVVTFAAVPDLAAVPAAPEPPSLVPGRLAPPLPATPADPDAGFTWPANEPGAGPHRFLPGPGARPPLPSQEVTIQTAAEDVPEQFGEEWLMAPVRAPGALAVLVAHTGQAKYGDGRPVEITLLGRHLMRLSRLVSGADGVAAMAEPVPRPAPDADDANVAALREAVLGLADPVPPGLRFELDRMRSLRSAEAVATWVLGRLDLPGDDLLAIYAMPSPERIAALLDRLAAGARFRPAEA